MLVPIYNPSKTSKDDFTEEEVLMLDKMHKERIKLSDSILVVNVNGYIGDSTKSEIEFAKSLNKKIIYYTDLIRWCYDKSDKIWNLVKEKVNNLEELSIYSIFDIANKIINVQHNELFDLPKDLLIQNNRW